jgi:hypothetical protein
MADSSVFPWAGVSVSGNVSGNGVSGVSRPTPKGSGKGNAHGNGKRGVVSRNTPAVGWAAELAVVPARLVLELPVPVTFTCQILTAGEVGSSGERFAATGAWVVGKALRARGWAVLGPEHWRGVVAAVERHRLFPGQLGALLSVVQVDPGSDPFRSLVSGAPGAEVDPALRSVGAVCRWLGVALEQVVVETEVPR